MEAVDVLVVGAGLSGIGAACHLRRRLPHLSVAVLEARAAIGGTWDLFRYPGVRSDSDMFTLGYRFAPWMGDRAIADGADIRAYVQATAQAYGVDALVRFGHRVTGAAWSSQAAQWTVTVETPHGPQAIRARFLWACTGYYDYAQGHDPRFPGEEAFRGRRVHPQHWPDDLDVRDRSVVIVGSGATAVTLVPALVDRGARVTLLQRTPTDVVAQPSREALAPWLGRILPAHLAARLLRWKNRTRNDLAFRVARAAPRLTRRVLMRRAAAALGPTVPVDPHFSPPYPPWDQRLCVVPDGDLFRVLRAGQARMVTDTIAHLTPTGVQLASGDHLSADILVTATGLRLQFFGGATLTVDGTPRPPGTLLHYKACLFSGVPNFALTMGYTNNSWTLKADLVADYVCRLLEHLGARGLAIAVPPHPGLPSTPAMPLRAGYVLRAAGDLTQQADRDPWRVYQDHRRDVAQLSREPIDDGVLQFPPGPVEWTPTGARLPSIGTDPA